jgi:hypothetical protein
MRQVVSAVSFMALMAAPGLALADPVVTALAANAPVSGEAVSDAGSVRVAGLDGAHNGAAGPVSERQGEGAGGLAVIATDLVTAAADIAGVDVGATAAAASTGNVTDATGGSRQATVSDSFNAFDGIAIVQQDTGSASALAAATAVASGAVDGPVDGAASASGSVAGNESISTGGERATLVADAWADASGIVTLQQNTGDGSVLSAATAVLLDDEDTAPSTVALSSLTQGSVTDAVAMTAGGTRTNDITDAFNGFSGIVTIQQNTGDNAVLAAATAVSPGAGEGLGAATLSSAALGATVSGNTTMAANLNGIVTASYTNSISNAFNDASGIITVQQNNGANSVLQSAITVAGRY